MGVTNFADTNSDNLFPRRSAVPQLPALAMVAHQVQDMCSETQIELEMW
jgi:hypothetical protein